MNCDSLICFLLKFYGCYTDIEKIFCYNAVAGGQENLQNCEKKKRNAAHMDTGNFQVRGCLNKGFQGHITYTFAAPVTDGSMDICFCFDQREAAEGLEELREGCRRALDINMPGREFTEEEYEVFYRMPKGEINVSVFHNGQCIGSAHRNTPVKNIRISPNGSSEGFAACHISAGVVRIVLQVLNVLNDKTEYELTVKGGGT